MPFGVDRPLPADFQVPCIAPPRRKPKFNPPIKQKGAVTKVTLAVKNGILAGAIAHGFDGEGLGGLEGYFQFCAARHPKHYMDLLAKLLPPSHFASEIDGTERPGVSINVVSIESGDYLSPEDVARLRSPSQPQPAEPDLKVIEHTPPEAPAPREVPSASETRTPEEKRLLATLESMDPEELLTRLGAALVNQ